MHVHRSRHVRGFTALPNYLLQDRRLSYTARGLLADLLSRPDGWREDGRQMADSSPQGRTAVAKALRELARAGYYRVEKIRQTDGTVVSESHVYDTPQPDPAAKVAGSGRRTVGRPDALPKDLVKEPSHPHPADRVDTARGSGLPGNGEGGRETAPDTTTARGEQATDSVPTAPVTPAPDAVAPQVREAAATLFRVIRPEPRLRLGTGEALGLAPLVAGWLERGASDRDLAAALLPGLPAEVHAPAALLRNRLARKLPPAPDQQAVAAPVAVRWHECAKCADPVPKPGICRACAGLPSRQPATGLGSAATARGAALVRAALQATRPTTATA
ncbi:hypothetical protein [Streptacidiphilus melanogenes]|uniref:hypothetical protein n=1 Tax=Streptacidiphilus melanogenes TaxID=411235 RepID=UPI001269A39F|nr:hypothetical protein [Streptacidiphilus melanogenes]